MNMRDYSTGTVFVLLFCIVCCTIVRPTQILPTQNVLSGISKDFFTIFSQFFFLHLRKLLFLQRFEHLKEQKINCTSTYLLQIFEIILI